MLMPHQCYIFSVGKQYLCYLMSLQSDCADKGICETEVCDIIPRSCSGKSYIKSVWVALSNRETIVTLRRGRNIGVKKDTSEHTARQHLQNMVVLQLLPEKSWGSPRRFVLT